MTAARWPLTKEGQPQAGNGDLIPQGTFTHGFDTPHCHENSVPRASAVKPSASVRGLKETARYPVPATADLAMRKRTRTESVVSPTGIGNGVLSSTAIQRDWRKNVRHVRGVRQLHIVGDDVLRHPTCHPGS